MAARSLMSLLSLILLAGGVLLQFLVILAGTSTGKPENLIYFLETTTNGIPGARNPSRWTLFYICGVEDGHNANCGKPVPALPFNPPGKSNFGTTIGVPDDFIGTHKYFYLSRFAFTFFIIATFFAVIALFTGLLALCTRLGAYLSSFNTFVAFFFQLLGAALMTSWSVLGRNHFNHNGQTAKLGKYGYGFTWAAAACFFLSTVLFCLGGSSGRDRETKRSTRGGFFRRRRSTRSRRSFVDSDRGGIKDDYS